MRGEFSSFVSPNSIALIGASAKEGSLGNRVLTKLVQNKEKKIYPINPKSETIMGLQCYPSVEDIPEEVDLAFIITPAKTVPDILRSCVRGGVKAVIISSAGFSEKGGRGLELKEEMLGIIGESHLRVVGPNCLGIYNLSENLDLTISDTIRLLDLKKGSIGFISQSGAYGITLLMKGLDMGIGFSKFFSLGNKIDVKDYDILEYLEDDPETEAVIIYMEAVDEGRKFIDLAARVSKKKPIIVCKVGKEEAGARAIKSHTGALAGSYKVYSAAFKDCGIIEATSSFAMLETAKVLSMQPVMKGNRVGIVTNSGGVAAETADLCHVHGLQLPELSDALQQRLKDEDAAPAYGSLKNPIDLGAPTPSMIDWYFRSTRLLLESGEVDAVLVIMAGVMVEWSAEKFHRDSSLLNSYGVPIVIMGIWKEEAMRKVRQTYHGASFPVVEDPVRAMESLDALKFRGMWGEV